MYEAIIHQSFKSFMEVFYCIVGINYNPEFRTLLFFPNAPLPLPLITHLPFLSYSSSLAALIHSHSHSHSAAGLRCLLVQWDLLIKSADGKPRGTMFNRWAQRRGFHSTTLAQSTGHFFWEKCVCALVQLLRGHPRGATAISVTH